MLNDELQRDLVRNGTAAAQIVTRGEVFAVGAQHDHRDVRVLSRPCPRRIEFVEQLGILRIGSLRAIQGDRRDLVGHVVVDVHGPSSGVGKPGVEVETGPSVITKMRILFSW